MKIVYFLKWSWFKFLEELKNWEHWQWATIITMFFASGAVFSPNGLYQQVCAKITVTILIVYWAIYVVVWGTIKRAWKKFNDEQEKMLNHLKDVG
jgi:uncharacterized sodium:solute symporter family permease YidK